MRRWLNRALVITCWSVTVLPPAGFAQHPAQTAEAPQQVTLRGRVVCVAEEFQRLYQVEADCDRRGHVYGLKTADGQLYPFLPTDTAAAVYDDQRVRDRELQVTARLFPPGPFIEVIKLQSVRGGRLYDLFYYCQVCNITTHKPGPCICCQEEVEFRETPAEDERRP